MYVLKDNAVVDIRSESDIKEKLDSDSDTSTKKRGKRRALFHMIDDCGTGRNHRDEKFFKFPIPSDND